MKTAIVTGGAKGIGGAVAARLARDGFSVAINYLNSEEKANTLSSVLVCEGLDAFTVRADVSVPSGAQELIKTVTGRTGRVDVLVNNAGIEYWGLFSEMSDADISRVTACDFLSSQYVSRAAIPFMLKNGGGRIINISSVWGQTGASCETAYSAAKAGVIGFTKALGKELAPSGITVNCVCPGVIKTDMLNRFTEDEINALKTEIPADRIGVPEDVAAAVSFFAREEAGYITSQVLGVNGGLV